MRWNDPLNPAGPNTGIVKNGQEVYDWSKVSGFGASNAQSFDGYKELIEGIKTQSKENNVWSAEQARKQMEFQERSQRKAMDFNAAEAAKNRNWQKMMSDTAHQREVRDLMAAGLNPVLSVARGNGAAVGSGATAGSVGVGSGSKGDTDTSSNAAIVSLLSAVLNRQTQLQIADTNAKTNLAVAEKYNAISKYLGELQNSTSLYLGEKGLINSMAIAGIQAAASQNVAGIHAAAQRYASDKSYQASVYASNVQSWTSKAVATINASSHIVGSGITAQANKYAANVAAAARRYEANGSWANARYLQQQQQIFEDYMKKHYPSNIWQAISGMASQGRDWLVHGDPYYGKPTAPSSAGGFGSSR